MTTKMQVTVRRNSQFPGQGTLLRKIAEPCQSSRAEIVSSVAHEYSCATLHHPPSPVTMVAATKHGGVVMDNKGRKCPAFERTSKRRRGFPSETRVKRGERVVHGDKELSEKLGRRDLCPCGSNRRFQELLLARRAL